MHPDLEKRVARLLHESRDDSGLPYGFDEFERRARARGARSRAAAAVLAATAVLAVATALVLRFSAPTLLRGESAAIVPRTGGADGTAAPGAAGARAELMEQWLAGLPREPAVVRVGTRAAVLGLEDRIAEVDDLLSAARVEQAQPARLAALQQERTRLVGTLLEVRYAETLADASR